MSIYRNQRHEERKSITGKIKYSRARYGVCFDARLEDCTDEGLCMVTNYPYLEHTKLFLQSKNADDHDTQEAEVTWSKPDPRSTKSAPRYRVGARYTTY